MKTQKIISSEDLMRKGYLEMAEETRRIMEEFKAADLESLKYLDLACEK